MSKPTPRPWRLVPNPADHPMPFQIVGKPDGGHGGHICNLFIQDRDNQYSANAAHIVKCVNMHDHVIKALKFARAEFDRISYQKKADPKVLEFMDMVLAEAEAKK